MRATRLYRLLDATAGFVRYPVLFQPRPEYISVQDAYGTERPFKKQEQKHQPVEEQALELSGELAIPIMESIACGKQRRLEAINIPNRGWIPNLPDEMVVEVPA